MAGVGNGRYSGPALKAAGVNGHGTYSEGLDVGYRLFDTRRIAKAPAPRPPAPSSPDLGPEPVKRTGCFWLLLLPGVVVGSPTRLTFVG